MINREAIFIADEEYDGVRIDSFIAAIDEDLSRSYVSKLIGEGAARINGIRVKKSSARVSEGDRISLDIPESRIPDILPEASYRNTGVRSYGISSMFQILFRRLRSFQSEQPVCCIFLHDAFQWQLRLPSVWRWLRSLLLWLP